jgi:hypothetical protein
MALSRDDILGAPDAALVEVDVPEWGGAVYVRPLLASEGADLGDEINAARLLVLSCVDKKGAKLFTDDDLEALGAKSLAATNRVMAAVLSANGMSNDARDALEGN